MTKSKLSPFLSPADAYLCKMANKDLVMSLMSDFKDGNSYFNIHSIHWSEIVFNLNMKRTNLIY